jgi:hypothetical protein
MTAATKSRLSASKVRATSRDSETIDKIISLSLPQQQQQLKQLQKTCTGWDFNPTFLSFRGLMLQEKTADPKYL